MEECLPRRLAAILYADVAGHSRLTGEEEDSTHHRLSEYPARLGPQAHCAEVDLSDGFSNQLSL